MVLLYVLIFTLYMKYTVKKSKPHRQGCRVAWLCRAQDTGPVFTHMYPHTNHLFCLGFYTYGFLCVVLQFAFSRHVLRNLLLEAEGHLTASSCIVSQCIHVLDTRGQLGYFQIFRKCTENLFEHTVWACARVGGALQGRNHKGRESGIAGYRGMSIVNVNSYAKRATALLPFVPSS